MSTWCVLYLHQLAHVAHTNNSQWPPRQYRTLHQINGGIRHHQLPVRLDQTNANVSGQCKALAKYPTDPNVKSTTVSTRTHHLPNAAPCLHRCLTSETAMRLTTHAPQVALHDFQFRYQSPFLIPTQWHRPLPSPALIRICHSSGMGVSDI